MKTLIAGSRSITDYLLVLKAMELARSMGIIPTEVVSGGALGVDSLGEQWARDNDIEVLRFQAQWHRYGKQAGMIRNQQMVDYADAAVIIWDGISRGTKRTVEMCQSKGITLVVLEAKNG